MKHPIKNVREGSDLMSWMTTCGLQTCPTYPLSITGKLKILVLAFKILINNVSKSNIGWHLRLYKI